MEVDAIVTEVEGIVQDTTYDETWIIRKFNEVLTLVATHVPDSRLTDDRHGQCPGRSDQPSPCRRRSCMTSTS